MINGIVCGKVRPAVRLICLTTALLAVLTALPAIAEARLMVLGDSLVAGYGLPPGQGFPAQLQRDLTSAGRRPGRP